MWPNPQFKASSSMLIKPLQWTEHSTLTWWTVHFKKNNFPWVFLFKFTNFFSFLLGEKLRWVNRCYIDCFDIFCFKILLLVFAKTLQGDHSSSKGTKFSERQKFRTPDTHTYICASGSKKYYFFRKILFK